MASFQFNHTPRRVMDQSINLTGGLYIHLVTAAPLPTQTTSADLAELTGGNYAPLFVPVTTVEDHGTNGGKLTIPPPTWELLTSDPLPIVGCVFASGSAHLISYLEFVEVRYATGQLTGSNFTVSIPASGILYYATATE